MNAAEVLLYDRLLRIYITLFKVIVIIVSNDLLAFRACYRISPGDQQEVRIYLITSIIHLKFRPKHLLNIIFRLEFTNIKSKHSDRIHHIDQTIIRKVYLTIERKVHEFTFLLNSIINHMLKEGLKV